MEKPIVVERFTDNGEHSHWELIEPKTGECLWSEYVEQFNTIGSRLDYEEGFV